MRFRGSFTLAETEMGLCVCFFLFLFVVVVVVVVVCLLFALHQVVLSMRPKLQVNKWQAPQCTSLLHADVVVSTPLP